MAASSVVEGVRRPSPSYQQIPLIQVCEAVEAIQLKDSFHVIDKKLQDGAPIPRAYENKNWIAENLPDFIKVNPHQPNWRLNTQLS